MGVRDRRPGESRYALGEFQALGDDGDVRITISQSAKMFDFPVSADQEYEVECVVGPDGSKHLEVHPTDDD